MNAGLVTVTTRGSLYLRIAIGIAALLLFSIYAFSTARSLLNPGAWVFVGIWMLPFYVFLRHISRCKLALLGGFLMFAPSIWGLVVMSRNSEEWMINLLVPFVVLLPIGIVLVAIDRSLPPGNEERKT